MSDVLLQSARKALSQGVFKRDVDREYELNQQLRNHVMVLEDLTLKIEVEQENIELCLQELAECRKRLGSKIVNRAKL